ncbi:MAG: hypothetical protein ABI203_08335 [Mucilaginibacter sp.]
MIRSLLVFAGLICLVNICAAQGSLNGRVYENKSRIALPGISIQNLKSNYITVSDNNGLFTIKAHLGDLIVFSGFSYQSDTLYVKDYNEIEIFLNFKSNMLKGIKVTNSEIRTGNLTAAPTLAPFGGHTVVYQKDRDGNYNGGLTTHLFDSHSAEKKRVLADKIEKNEGVKQKIDKAFNAKSLEDYLPLKGQEMENFIILYKPDINTFTEENFNLAAYVTASYKEFLKIPAETRRSKQFLDLNAKPVEEDAASKP